MSEKVLTRAEYYKQQGFSGSNIDRPDDPVDDEFIRHINGLKAFANGFIEHCRTSRQTPYSSLLENSNVEVDADENIRTIVNSTDNLMKSVRELLKLYTRLHYLYEVKSTSTEKVLTSTEFAEQALQIVDQHSAAVKALLTKQQALEDQLNTVKLELIRAKREHNYIDVINNLCEQLKIE